MTPTAALSALLALGIVTPVIALDSPSLQLGTYDRDTTIRLDRAQVRTIATPRASFQRLLLRVEGEGPLGTAAVRLNTIGGTTIQFFGGEELRESTWSHVVPGDRMELVFTPGASGAVLVIERVVGQGEPARLLSQWGDHDETQPIMDYKDHAVISRQARSVAFLSFMKDSFPRVCTGFLVNGGLVTNHHCISTAKECASAVAVFGFELQPDGQTDIGEQFGCAAVARLEPELDVVVLTLKGAPQARFGVIDAMRQEATSGGPAYIIQHAAGAAKTIAFRNCGVDKIGLRALRDGSDFSHICDTDHGSSGSPVFNEHGHLIGVHHFGFKDDTQLWDSNRAVRINAAVPPLGE